MILKKLSKICILGVPEGEERERVRQQKYSKK